MVATFEGIEMPHDKIAEMTGERHSTRMKGSPFEHNPHATAMAKGMLKAENEVAEILGKKRG